MTKVETATQWMESLANDNRYGYACDALIKCIFFLTYAL